MKVIHSFLALLTCVAVYGQKPNKNTAPYPYGNPVITHMYTADAAPHVMPDGRVWMVTSVDHEDGGNYSTMHAYHTFSSADMVNWIDHGEILHVSDLWGEEGEPKGQDWALWAPDMVYYQGRYLLYFPVRIVHTDTVKPNGGRVVTSYIAVAESEALDQRFRVIKSKIAGTSGIDPAVFVDDDGERYLYYGRHLGAKLKDNMIELDGKPVSMEVNDHDFMEASWMHKRDGQYYFSYHRHYGKPIDPENPDDPARGKSRLNYGISNSPLGPFEFKGVLNYELGVNVQEGPTLPGRTYVPWRLFQSNHGGIVAYHGKEYLFYHTSALSSWRQDEFKGPGTWTQRSVCIDELRYTESGDVLPVKQTVESVEPVSIQQPYEIPCVFDPTSKGKGRQKLNIKENRTISLGKVNLGSGYYYFGVQTKGFEGKGTIEIRADQPDGALLGTLILDTGSAFIDSEKSETLIREATGERDIFLIVHTNSAKKWTLSAPRFFAGSPVQINR